MSDESRARKLRMEADVLWDQSRVELASLKLQNAGLVEDCRRLRAEAAASVKAARSWRSATWWVCAANAVTFLVLVAFRAGQIYHWW